MDTLSLSLAFLFGLAARQVGLPPLVGFLGAGFVLQALGVRPGEALEAISDLGVTLLLFTIGLKLRIQSLLRPEIWAGTTLHMAVTVGVVGLAVLGLGSLGIAFFAGLDAPRALLLGFALSFSSTVFAAKVLEGKGEMGALHGRVAIGVLIMQDILAVLFLTASTGKLPSPWAVALLALFLVRPLLTWVMERCGHGELLLLYGLFVALVVGAGSFEWVGMKADLGAIVVGMLLAPHPKAGELAKTLLGFKDLLLVGFFLSIGMSGAPRLEDLGLAALLVLAVPFKVALFFLLFTRFRLRARTSLLGALALATYSEFALIVESVGVKNGWIGTEYLIVTAISVAATFLLASPLNEAAHRLYARFAERLQRFETELRHPDDVPIDVGDAQVAIFGMGRVGQRAYDALREHFGEILVGIERDPRKVRAHQAEGRNVILGDSTDSDFWERVTGGVDVRLILLTMPSHREVLTTIGITRRMGSDLLIAATARHPDEVAELEAAGVDAAFNFFADAGLGFAEHVWDRLGDRLEAITPRS